MAPSKRERRGFAALGVWLVLNVGLHLWNRGIGALCGFAFPITGILAGTTATLLGTAALQLARHRRATLKRAAAAAAALRGVRGATASLRGDVGGGGAGGAAGDGVAAGDEDDIARWTAVSFDHRAAGGGGGGGAVGGARPLGGGPLAAASRLRARRAAAQDAASVVPPLLSLAYGQLLLDAARPYLAEAASLGVVGATFGLAATFENLSTQKLSVQLNQIIKATAPAMSLAAAAAATRWPRFAQISGSGGAVGFASTWLGRGLTSLIVLGSILGVRGNLEGHDPLGVVFAIASTVLGVWQSLLTERVLQRCQGFTAIGVSLAAALPAVGSIIPLFLYAERRRLAQWSPPAQEDLPETCPSLLHGPMSNPVLLSLLPTALVAVVYNFSHYAVIDYTSAHYSLIAGNAKVVIVVLAAEIAYPVDKVFKGNGWNIFGFILCLAGFVTYNFLNHRASRDLHAADGGGTGEYAMMGPGVGAAHDDDDDDDDRHHHLVPLESMHDSGGVASDRDAPIAAAASEPRRKVYLDPPPPSNGGEDDDDDDDDVIALEVTTDDDDDAGAAAGGGADDSASGFGTSDAPPER